MSDLTFRKDLLEGQEAEILFGEEMINRGHSKPFFNRSKNILELRGWDLEIVLSSGRLARFEVKLDRMSKKTGNLALEFFGRNAPAGIAATTADYFVFISGEEFYIFEVAKLKEMASTGKYRSLQINNQTAWIYLLPIKDVKQYSLTLN